MARATDIYNKAKEEIILFAKFEMGNIKGWLIRTGQWDENDEDWEHSPYWLDLSDFNIPNLVVDTEVTNPHTLETYVKEKRVVAIRYYKDEKISVVFDDAGEDELALPLLKLLDIVKVTNLLEDFWNRLVREK